ncbi:MAG TPA: hypothetical protein VNE38_13580 [Ktedonobacteraceae bacterium]|nr:hypothetical protein [Ktedonobacteraceae bacterium]
MPKKTASARGGASRNKPKTQKNIQLVRPVSENNDVQEESGEDESTASAAVPTAAVTSTATVAKPEVATATKSSVDTLISAKEQASAEIAAANKGSAASRLAARRQVAQKQQAQRNVGLITSEHYAYVKRDLIYIAILASIFFATLIVLHFVPAIGG